MIQSPGAVGGSAKSMTPTIAWSPVHPLDLPLENLDLAPQGKRLGLQLGLVAMAGCQHIQ